METTTRLFPIGARCRLRLHNVTGWIVAQAQYPHPELWIVQLDNPFHTTIGSHTFTTQHLVTDESCITLIE